MKRHSITAIIKKAQHLSIYSDRITNIYSGKTIQQNAAIHYKNIISINKAAVNEIIRLLAEDKAPAISSPDGKDSVATSVQPGPSALQEEICGQLKTTP